MKRIFVLATLLLAGCSSAPEPVVSQYLLPQLKIQASQVPDSSMTERPLLVVRPVELASYLSNNGIVYRTSETQIIQAKHNQWAENLSDQITQRVVANLRQSQARYWPVEVNNLLDQSNQSKLQLTLDHFNGSYRGNAEISGEWQLIDPNGNVKKRADVQLSMPLQDEGYDALVEALSNGLETLTDDIARQL
ncbi:ABC-type transport auxiliary lipoprotein family protein [Vibrio mytili]|uniref:PqiC family protein n=1 Tax=Vibrio mytili TaxID=50718 RepID=UPI003C6F7FD6